jgi:hypothetical protein
MMSGYPYHQIWLLDLDGHITDSICIDMVQQASTMTTHTMMMVV